MKNKNVKESIILNFKGEKIVQIECIFFKENHYHKIKDKRNDNNFKK
jgi:hypothetical protein